MTDILRTPEQARHIIGGHKCVVMFSSPSCSPCKSMYPLLQSLADGGLAVAIIDVTEHPGFAGEYRVRALPTIALFIRGGLEKMFVGSMIAVALEKWVNA